MKSSLYNGLFFYCGMLDCEFDFVPVVDSTPNTKRQTIFDTGFDFVPVGGYGIRNKEVEFVPAFYNFKAFNIFHSPRFQPWEKKNSMIL